MSLVIAGARSTFMIDPGEVEPEPEPGTMEHELLNGRRGIGADGKAWHLDTDSYNRLMGNQFYRGVFNNEDELIAAFPSDVTGAFAIVLSTGTTWVWSVDTTSWVDSGKSISDGGIPIGGTTGQVLTKKSDVDKDVHWTTITASGAIPQHNDLAGLQGGNATERYHITKEQHDKIVSGKIDWNNIENITHATTVVEGILRIATVPEVIEGVDNTTAVSPFGLQMKINALPSSQLDQDKINAINGANNPSGDNVFVTKNDLDSVVTNITPNLMPVGGIIMWSGMVDTIPSGWGLCNGQNGTPDLTDKFIMGASGAAVNPGATGGANSLELTTSNLPSHDHAITGGSHTHSMTHTHSLSSATAASAGAHTHTLSGSTPSGPSLISYPNISVIDVSSGGSSSVTGIYYGNSYGTSKKVSQSDIPSTGSHTHILDSTGSTASNGAHTHNVSGSVDSFSGVSGSTAPTLTVGSSGNSVAFDNRPSYYALAFIMKLQG